MLDDRVVESLRAHWEEGFNAYDIEAIMTPIGPDIIFSSPFVPRLTGDPSQLTIEGRDAFRTYIADSMRRVPDIRYAVDATFVSTETIVFVYSCHFADGQVKTGSDYLRVDAAQNIVEWRSHYTFDPGQIDALIQD